jgi:hypothetical protein
MPHDDADRPEQAKLTLPEVAAMRRSGDRIVMVTVYDAPSARLADAAGDRHGARR